MGRQGAIRAARAAMKREGRKPEEIPAQPPTFTARREATVKLLSALDASRAEVKALRVAHAEYERDAEAVHAEVAGERDALAAEVKRLAVVRDDLRAEVEGLKKAIAGVLAAIDAEPVPDMLPADPVERAALHVSLALVASNPAMLAEFVRSAVVTTKAGIHARIDALTAPPPVHFEIAAEVNGDERTVKTACDTFIEHGVDVTPESMGYSADRAKVRGCGACVAAAEAAT